MMLNKKGKMNIIFITMITLTLIIALAAPGQADNISANISIQNAEISVSNVVFLNEQMLDSPISLASGAAVTITVNATIADSNGYLDISQPVTGRIWHESSNYYAANDMNSHYTNSDCTFSHNISTTEAIYFCSYDLEFFALNGTWQAAIIANGDNSTSSQVVNALVSMDLNKTSITYDSLALGQNTTTPERIDIENLGNREGDLLFKSTILNCSVQGAIAADHLKTGLTNTGFDGLNYTLSESLTVQDTNSPGVRGIATNDFTASWQEIYTGIRLDSTGLAGDCSGTLTISMQDSTA